MSAKFLLDTHILIWAIAEPRRLPVGTAALIAEEGNDVLFSAISIFEAAVKFGLRKPDFPHSPRVLLHDALEAGFTELQLSSTAAARVADFALHHRDPFDRLLVAQAAEAGARLLTSDAALAAYSPHVLLTASDGARVSLP